MKNYKYLVNQASKQVHQADQLTPQCGVDKMSQAHKLHCGGFVRWWLMSFRGYDGCGHCFKEKDRGL